VANRSRLASRSVARLVSGVGLFRLLTALIADRFCRGFRTAT
jgi:hypothetical protein